MKTLTSAIALTCCFMLAGPAQADELPPVSEQANEATQTLPHTSMEKVAEDIIFYAVSMVGINYRWGGSSPQTGFDCSGLVGHVFRQIAGLVLPRNSSAMARMGKPVHRHDLEPGDLVFFNTMRRPFSHVGIYLGENRFVHAPARGKTVHVVDMTDPYWARRYNGARRIDL